MSPIGRSESNDTIFWSFIRVFPYDWSTLAFVAFLQLLALLLFAGTDEANVWILWEGWKWQLNCLRQQGSSHILSFWNALYYSVSSEFVEPELLLCLTQAAVNAGVKAMYGLKKRVEAVGNVRKLTKLDMMWNDALPHIEVDPETYTVKADGEVLTCPPATSVPLSQNYFLF